MVLFLGVGAPCPSFGKVIDSSIQMIVGGDLDYKLYTFLDSNGIAKGFNVDIIKYIAEKEGYNLKIQFSQGEKNIGKT